MSDITKEMVSTATRNAIACDIRDKRLTDKARSKFKQDAIDLKQRKDDAEYDAIINNIECDFAL